MRVRESKPSAADVQEFYSPIDTALITIAAMESTTAGRIISMYLSKVGSWRKGYAPLPLVVFGTQHEHDLIVQEFWIQANERLEGAPIWLEEVFIKYWKTWLEGWEDTALESEDVWYIRTILREALKTDKQPRDLP